MGGPTMSMSSWTLLNPGQDRERVADAVSPYLGGHASGVTIPSGSPRVDRLAASMTSPITPRLSDTPVAMTVLPPKFQEHDVEPGVGDGGHGVQPARRQVARLEPDLGDDLAELGQLRGSRGFSGPPSSPLPPNTGVAHGALHVHPGLDHAVPRSPLRQTARPHTSRATSVTAGAAASTSMGVPTGRPPFPAGSRSSRWRCGTGRQEQGRAACRHRRRTRCSHAHCPRPLPCGRPRSPSRRCMRDPSNPATGGPGGSPVPPASESARHRPGKGEGPW